MRDFRTAASLMAMASITATLSTPANSQEEIFDTSVALSTSTLRMDDTVTSIDLQVSVNIEPFSQNGIPLPAGPPDLVGEIMILGLGNTNPTFDLGQHCTRLSLQQFDCAVQMPVTASDRTNQNLVILADVFFWQQVGAYLYSNDPGLANRTLGRLDFPEQNCASENSPMLPTSSSLGIFVFSIPAGEVCGRTFFIDPPVSTGFDYTVTGAKFTSVTMPSMQTVPDPDGYIVTIPGTNIVPVRAQPGRRVQLPFPTSQVRVRDIDPALQLDPASSQAFAMGVELTTPTGNVTITQTAETIDYTPPPAVTGLLGDDVLLRAMNYAPSTQSAVVSTGLEFGDFQGRFDVDVSASKIRIDLAHPHGRASYGNGYFLNLLNLNPNTSGCSGVPFIQSIATSTSKADADITRTGASHTDNSVSIPLAPVGAVLDWDLSDWIEVDLTFGCRAGPPINPMGGELRQPPGAVRSPPVLRRPPPPPPPPVRQTTRTGESKRTQPR